MIEYVHTIKLSTTELDLIKQGTAKVVVEIVNKPKLELQSIKVDVDDQRHYTDNNLEIGYFKDDVPTDAQLKLQDEFDSVTQEYIDGLLEIYSRHGQDDRSDFPHDIRVLTEIRERAQDVLQLKDIY